MIFLITANVAVAHSMRGRSFFRVAANGFRSDGPGEKITTQTGSASGLFRNFSKVRHQIVRWPSPHHRTMSLGLHNIVFCAHVLCLLCVYMPCAYCAVCVYARVHMSCVSGCCVHVLFETKSYNKKLLYMDLTSIKTRSRINQQK